MKKMAILISSHNLAELDNFAIKFVLLKTEES